MKGNKTIKVFLLFLLCSAIGSSEWQENKAEAPSKAFFLSGKSTDQNNYIKETPNYSYGIKKRNYIQEKGNKKQNSVKEAPSKHKHEDFLSSLSKLEDLEEIIEKGSNIENYWLLIKSFLETVIAHIEERYSISGVQSQVFETALGQVLSVGDKLNLLHSFSSSINPELADHVKNTVLNHQSLQEVKKLVWAILDFAVAQIQRFFGSGIYERILDASLDTAVSYFLQFHSESYFKDYIKTLAPNNTLVSEILMSAIPNHNNKYISGSFPESLHKIADEYKRKKREAKDNTADTIGERNGRSISRDGGYGHHGGGGGGGYGHSGYGGGGHGSGYGGGGGGGYGGYGMSTLDPYVVLATLALGALLGFLLFRLLNTSAAGRQIDDDFLLLWLTDLPNAISNVFGLPQQSLNERTKRDVGDQTDAEPFTDHLNQLWNVFQHNSDKSCISQFLCNELSATSGDILAGPLSSSFLLMASTSDILGATHSGRMLDQITQNTIFGNQVVCPRLPQCVQA